MSRRTSVTLLLCFLATLLGGPSIVWAQTAKDRLEALVEQFEDDGDPRKFADKFIKFAVRHRKDAAAIDALEWILTNQPKRPVARKAIELLHKEHLRSDQLGKVFEPLIERLDSRAERLLQAAIHANPHKKVQAQACLQLATLWDNQLRIARQLQSQPQQRQRAEQYYGKGLTAYLLKLKPSQLVRRQEKLFEKMLRSFPKLRTAEGDLIAAHAKKALFALRNLSIGKVAPEISGEDIDGRRFKLSAYRGKVVMISFWGHW